MPSKSILGLNKFNNKEIKVKLCGGREVIGILRGFDAVTNLVLDETVEYMFDKDEFLSCPDQKRRLGLLVIRGASVLMICPSDGSEVIENPYCSP
ncbi:Sm-like protein Lsm7 [Cryptosporidium tyzzeri]|nr:Sm-like protein Lsm7 [Cryptosporidium tyzzeri]